LTSQTELFNHIHGNRHLDFLEACKLDYHIWSRNFYLVAMIFDISADDIGFRLLYKVLAILELCKRVGNFCAIGDERNDINYKVAMCMLSSKVSCQAGRAREIL
jgi:hypothetical protein